MRGVGNEMWGCGGTGGVRWGLGCSPGGLGGCSWESRFPGGMGHSVRGAAWAPGAREQCGCSDLQAPSPRSRAAGHCPKVSLQVSLGGADETWGVTGMVCWGAHMNTHLRTHTRTRRHACAQKHHTCTLLQIVQQTATRPVGPGKSEKESVWCCPGGRSPAR